MAGDKSKSNQEGGRCAMRRQQVRASSLIKDWELGPLVRAAQNSFYHLVIEVLTQAVLSRQLVTVRVLGGVRRPGGGARQRGHITVFLCGKSACNLTVMSALHHLWPDQRALGHNPLNADEGVEERGTQTTRGDVMGTETPLAPNVQLCQRHLSDREREGGN